MEGRDREKERNSVREKPKKKKRGRREEGVSLYDDRRESIEEQEVNEPGKDRGEKDEERRQMERE